MASIVDRHATETGKQGGKRWQVRWRDDRNIQRRKAFAKKAEAERFASQIEHEINTGSYRDPRAGQIPFDEYARLWLQSQVQLRDSTKALYRGAVENHLIPFFGGMPLKRITVETGRQFLALDIPPRAKEVAGARLKQIIRRATDELLLPHNALQTLKIPQATPKEARFLTLAEVDRIADEIHPHFRTLIRSAAFLGLRQGELFGLHPDNLDLANRRVRVVEQLLGDVSPPVRGDVKTKTSKRVVTIPSLLIPELQEQLNQRASDDFVFTSVQGTPIRKSNFTRRYWKPAATATGFAEVVFHELRHTAATIAIQAGAHPKALQLRMGHSSITVTLDRYGHLMPGADEALADSIDDLIAAQGHLSDDVVPLPTAGFG